MQGRGRGVWPLFWQNKAKIWHKITSCSGVRGSSIFLVFSQKLGKKCYFTVMQSLSCVVAFIHLLFRSRMIRFVTGFFFLADHSHIWIGAADGDKVVFAPLVDMLHNRTYYSSPQMEAWDLLRFLRQQLAGLLQLFLLYPHGKNTLSAKNTWQTRLPKLLRGDLWWGACLGLFFKLRFPRLTSDLFLKTQMVELVSQKKPPQKQMKEDSDILRCWAEVHCCSARQEAGLFL